ncbi:MAG: hypothetical protein ACFB15_21585 [Cyclobacteriaceae bacterium]
MNNHFGKGQRQKKNRIVRYITYGIGIILLVYVFGKTIYVHYHLYKYSSYTTGEVIGFSRGGRGNKMVDYEFFVSDEKYTGSSWYDDEVKPEVGDQYIVRYSSRDPDISRMIF